MQEIEIRSGVIRPVECAKEAYELIKSDYWLLFAIWLVGGMIGGVSIMIASGAMMCGTFYAYLRKIDGNPVSFDDLWKGMQWFLPGLVIMAIIILPIIVIYGLIYAPILLAGMATYGGVSETELLQIMIGALLVDLILLVITVSLHTLMIFAIPLIVDKGLGPIKAITTSAKAVFKNFSGIAGLIGVNFLLVLAGYAALCVGVYFVIPIIIATTVVAYRRVFPALATPNLNPPPPSYGGGLS